MTRNSIALPRRALTWSDDTDHTVPCHICRADVPAEYEPDPDADGSGGVTTVERTCDVCGEPTCRECLDEDGPCAKCRAEASVVELGAEAQVKEKSDHG